ncbi:MAG: hypothetical protein IPL67_06460 [Ignavibacteria bacterium]|nr:hypothetical protein [Ignavibacteria bacterium]
MRNFAGTKYAEKNLNMDMFKKIAGKTKFDPRLTKAISIGGDVRVAQVDNEVDGKSNYNSFLAMQGDAYLNVELNKIVDVFVIRHSYPGIETRYEVYGMLHNLPANGFFKVGRFKPNYGIRIVEHRAYQRQFLLGTPYEANTGLRSEFLRSGLISQPACTIRLTLIFSDRIRTRCLLLQPISILGSTIISST